MLVNNLISGDFVYLRRDEKGRTLKRDKWVIKQVIGSKGDSVLLDGFGFANIADIEPIPLNETILEKIGFYKTGIKGYFKMIFHSAKITYDLNEGRLEVEALKYREVTTNIIKVNKKFQISVDEFNHAMRFAGLNKEINLFD